MLKKDKTSLMLTVGAAVLLIAGGIGAYLLIASTDRTQDVPVGASVIPQDAMMTISLSTDSKEWDKLREYGTPESKAALDRILGDLRDRFLTANGYGYQQDIQPWVGKEVTIAFLQNNSVSPNPSASPAQQSVAVVMPIANPLKAKELLAQPKPVNQAKMVERNYKGIKVAEIQGVPDRNLSVAVLGSEYLVVTTDAKATDRAIDTYKGEASLAKTPGFKESLEQIKTNQPFAQVYFNVPVSAAYASLNSARPISPQNLEKLETQGFATAVTLESEGIAFKSISWLKPDSQKKLAVENNAEKMLTRLPNNTLMAISGGNLQRLWQDYAQGADTNPIAPLPPEAVRSGLKSSTGMDWDKDFINWMKGEFSFSLIPGPATQNTPGKFAAGFVFMVEASDRKAADKSLKQLDEVMKTKKFKVEETQAGGQPAVKWTAPFGGVSVTRGWMKNNVAFMTVGAPVADAILPAPSNPLLGSEIFENTMRSELTPNNGNFFIDVDQAFNPKNLAIPELPPNQKMWVDAIRSIGVTTAVVSDRTIRYDAFVQLKKVNQASPQPGPSPTIKSSPK
ncbi:DUF3352 domain-containing protein [Kamptonema sp. UHCC 0994]|uniref:DUF3352 domain-containing protein n=1 Tax=Kamptonema sp. UHCC 0994 TaxID=3031329 RepID=UPI0023B97045|nr:DUF3352 domain-containing protein [Kamptonema sp. UHCC 0994]MDF0555744.1 DUF3352 domain-containing protein [Kamptonema sp. UHCC 0994]